MTVSTIGWFNLSWLLLDFVIVAVLIPTILLQRRESGAPLAWIMVILFIPFAGLIAFWLLGTTRLHLRRRKRRKVESLLAPEIQRIQSHADYSFPPEDAPQSLIHLARKFDGTGPLAGNQIEIYRSGHALFDDLEEAIDGRQAFIGGMNIGDQYAAKAEPWIDLHARVYGPVVHSIQEIFCQDWYHASAEDLVSRNYFPPADFSGPVHAQLLSSGPADERWRSIHTFIFAAINLAREKVFIETPYFVPDQPILLALRCHLCYKQHQSD
ncbi:MAG: PLDc N-terminal domain-containing protein [Candidatus Thiodiazotropha sp.]